MTAPTLADAARTLRESGVQRVWLYFIQQGCDGPIKIGLARDPADRLRTLQQGNPVELHLIGVYRAFAVEERELHDQFEQWRLRGEWFTPNAELALIIDLLTDHDVLAEFNGGRP